MTYSVDFNEIHDILKETQEKIEKRKKCQGDNSTHKIKKDVETCVKKDHSKNNFEFKQQPKSGAKKNHNEAQIAEDSLISKLDFNRNKKGDLTTSFEKRLTKREKALGKIADLKVDMRRKSNKEENIPDVVSLYSTSGEDVPVLKKQSVPTSVPNLSPQVTGFTKCGPPISPYNPFSQTIRSPSEEWMDCTNRAPNPVHPICCGPSKVKPLFDSKIEKLEKQIVKHCLEIKDTNILLAQCCRSKEVLECQKLALHNVLLKLCGKIKELETKLHTIKMAICCPNMPVVCTSSFDCREEIKQMRRIEEKIETCHYGLKHKECLLNICKKTVEVLNQDKEEWEKDMQDMDKIRIELQKQIDDMKQKVCKKVEDTPATPETDKSAAPETDKSATPDTDKPASPDIDKPSTPDTVAHRLHREHGSKQHRTSSQLRRVHKRSYSEDVSDHLRHTSSHRLTGSRKSNRRHSKESKIYEEGSYE